MGPYGGGGRWRLGLETAVARFGGHRHANPFFYDLAATGAARPLWGVSGAGLAVRPEARIQRKSWWRDARRGTFDQDGCGP